ncbi:Hypothetical predicted protein, partial [Pelobates cultripes]
MTLLVNQPSEWVSELETLVETEVWLDESYRAMRWHAYFIYLGQVSLKCIEGEDYDVPGLLWEFFSHFWYIRDEREDSLGLMEIAEMQPDLTFLANLEWELEQEYARLFNRVTLPVSDMMELMDCTPPEALSFIPPPQQISQETW